MARAGRVCPVIGCPVITEGGRCVTHRREADRARLSAADRGYGPDYRAARAQWAARLRTEGPVPCSRCGRLVGAAERWHLDHSDDRLYLLGPAHEFCNNSAGGRAAHG